MSFNIKGILHLVRDSPEQAAISFSQGNSLEKNVDSYTGNISFLMITIIIYYLFKNEILKELLKVIFKLEKMLKFLIILNLHSKFVPIHHDVLHLLLEHWLKAGVLIRKEM